MEDRFDFRAWDKIKKEMFYVKMIDLCGGYLWNINTWDLNKQKETAYELESCVLMQCTGLRDKNGKLVFEGDLLKIYCSISGSKDKKFRTCKIVWEKQGLTGFNFHIWYKNEWWGYGSADFTEGIEIIGNRFENSELLQGDK